MDNGASSYRRFLDGDDEGLAEIVRDYSDGLTLYLNGFVKNLTVAEELMEETFFKLVIKKPRFKIKSTFKTWLYTIGRNIALDYLRKNSKQADIAFDDLESVLKDETNLEERYIREERMRTLHYALKQLNPEYRQVLWLLFFEGFSVSEVSFIMKKNTRQMKNLVYRAKSALRSQLNKEGFVYEEL